MNKFIIFLLLLVFVSGCASKEIVDDTNNAQIVKNTSQLPDSFTISLYGDFTSSGGSRYLHAELIFVDDKLVSGWKKFERYEGSGNNYVDECVADINSLTWVGVTNSTDFSVGNTPSCSGSEFLDKNELQGKIDSGELDPDYASCPHATICYTIN